MAKSGLAQMQLLKRTQGVDAKSALERAAKNPLDVEAQIICADLEIANGQLESAFNRLLICVKQLTDEDKNRAKQHLINLFGLVDPADPRLIQARKDLASALF